MSKVQILTKETAEQETVKLLKQHDHLFLGKPNDDLIRKVKKRHSHGIRLLTACQDIYVKLGSLSSGKQDKFLCFRRIVQVKRGGNMT